MDELSARDIELVALGAAIASNCVPCVEYHVPQARKTGLTDPQITEAVRVADRVRQVPAGKVLSVALGLLGHSEPAVAETTCSPMREPASSGRKGGACCG